MIRYVSLLLILIFAGCATAPISADPIRDILPSGPGTLGGVVVAGLLDATFNLDSAVKVGALDATDPAPKCFHGVLTQLGVDPANPVPPGQSFTPKVSDLISAGSVLYIRARQLQKAQGQGVSVPAGCKELIAQFLLDAAAAGVKGLPGGGLAIPFR